MTSIQASAKPLRVGIALTSNVRGGPQKVSAVAALDLARNGHQVKFFIPVMPYHFYLAELNGSRKQWLRASLAHIKVWAALRKFVFQDMWAGDQASQNISVHFVPIRPSKKQLEGLDCLILHSVAQISEYKDRYPQTNQIFLIHHPEERIHGHDEEFKQIRRDFEGKIIAISPFTAQEISDHVPNIPVVADPVSATFWSQRMISNPTATRRDILLFWKNQDGWQEGREIIKALQSIRPETSLTIWCRGRTQAMEAFQDFPSAKIVDNLTEDELCEQYLNHSFLVFSYTYEGFGMPPIEGLACGCIPIQYSGVGAANIYARDGENSIILGPPTYDIAKRIAILLNDPISLGSMRDAAPGSISQFTPEGYGLRLLKSAGLFHNICTTISDHESVSDPLNSIAK